MLFRSKVRQIKEFIGEGHKVKVTLQYRGRENAHKELGIEVVNKVIDLCSQIAVVEQPPKLIGRLLGCLLAQKPATKGAASSTPGQQNPAARSEPAKNLVAVKPKKEFDPLQI